MKNKVLFFPTNLDIKKVIENDTVLTLEQKKQGIKYYQRVLYPVSRIIQEYKLNKSFNSENIDDVYVQLNMSLLNKIFGSKSFYWIIPFLIRNKIIVKSKKRYYADSHSDSYRIGNEYLSKYYSQENINILTDKTLFNNLHKKINLNDKYIKNVYDVLSRIKIDAKKCIEILNKKMGEKNSKYISYYNSILSSFLCTLKSENSSMVKDFDFLNDKFIKNYFDSVRDLDLLDDEKSLDVFNSWMINITKILEKDFFIKVGESSGRIFTNLTSLPKELRECITITPKQGDFEKKSPKLCDIDISNSQPFLFNKFLLENYDLEDDLFLDKYEDVRLYIRLTSEGKLYEYVMNEIGVDDRELFKKDFFGSIFYCQTKSNLRNLNSKVFEKLFPNVYLLILKMKEGNYKNLALQLQKFEVDVIINNVSKTLFEEGIEHFTIHDSILCYNEDKEIVEALMIKSLRKYGLHPSIKIK